MIAPEPWYLSGAWPRDRSIADVLRAQPLGFGTAPLGNLHRAITEDAATEAVRSAHALGVRYFDTAPYYGLGLAERRLGRALASLPRSSYVISTKVGRLLAPNPWKSGSDLANGFDVPDDLRRQDDYTRQGCLRSLESSLTRLGIESVDIALVHDPEVDYRRSVTEAIPTLIDLRNQRIVRAVGIGTSDAQCALRIVGRHDLDVVLLANRWTLFDRSGFALLEQCARQNIPVIAAAPFNGGGNAHDQRDKPSNPGASSSSASVDDEWVRVCLQFPQRHPAVAIVLTGMRSAVEVQQNVAAVSERITAETWSRVDAELARQHPDKSRRQ